MMQLGAFFALAIAGIVAGFVYEFGNLLKLIAKRRIYAVVPIDFAVAIIFGAIFSFVEYKYLNFKLSLLYVVFFVLGVCIERTSLGFLLAKSFKGIYNGAARALGSLKNSSIGKRALK